MLGIAGPDPVMPSRARTPFSRLTGRPHGKRGARFYTFLERSPTTFVRNRGDRGKVAIGQLVTGRRPHRVDPVTYYPPDV